MKPELHTHGERRAAIHFVVRSVVACSAFFPALAPATLVVLASALAFTSAVASALAFA